jgi:hypothetical protein
MVALAQVACGAAFDHPMGNPQPISPRRRVDLDHCDTGVYRGAGKQGNADRTERSVAGTGLLRCCPNHDSERCRSDHRRSLQRQ